MFFDNPGDSLANDGADGDDVIDVTGSSLSTSLAGGPGNDVFVLDDANFDRIDGGAASDTFRLDRSGIHLDLTAIPDNRILDIEQLDLGNGTQTLTLNFRELLNISGQSNTLVVQGQSNDVVDIGSGWSFGASKRSTASNSRSPLKDRDWMPREKSKVRPPFYRYPGGGFRSRQSLIAHN
ncbi:MAG: hypothetical protein CMJ64_13695 [Planctomycetaceae bacterium]|nr:hypothetical protein [Planctomycetaceae bacterium]